MRFLFVKSRLEWPRTYGHDVHCFEMMRALAGLGHEIGMATDTPLGADALTGLTLSDQWVLTDESVSGPISLPYLQERYRRYWGISVNRIARLRQIARDWRADAVVVVGLEILPYLAAPDGPLRVWYAADEWVRHHLSQLRSSPLDAIPEVKQAVIKGLYERSYAPAMDRVWVVSEAERRAMKVVTGVNAVDVIPNGVDATAFFVPDSPPTPHSAVFWGRLGFGPNLQALRWFVRRVWPLVRSQVPHATFTILGADPPAEVAEWNGQTGIIVTANPPDLRPEIARCNVVVLPFVSGGGIKNKLLEAAAMSRPIVASTRAIEGLPTAPPVVLADSPRAFAKALWSLWDDPARGSALGSAARDWVTSNHTWEAAARKAARSVARHKAGRAGGRPTLPAF